MVSLATYRMFDVVIVPFPYADRLAEKRRPAIVVSRPELSQKYRLVWLLMVTSADNPRWEHDIEISDLGAAALPAPSLVRPAKIATADSSRVIRRIGKLSHADARAVMAKFDALLAKSAPPQKRKGRG